jgi:hypothetical protein
MTARVATILGGPLDGQRVPVPAAATYLEYVEHVAPPTQARPGLGPPANRETTLRAVRYALREDLAGRWWAVREEPPS